MIQNHGLFAFFTNFAVHFFDIDAQIVDAFESLIVLDWEAAGNHFGTITGYVVPPTQKQLRSGFTSDAACMADLLQLATVVPTIIENVKSLIAGDIMVIETVI